MCGICGVFSSDGHITADVRKSVFSMTAELEHRGPDGAGYFSDECVAFGHRRLAIIDLPGGKQPFANEDESHVVLFNGEIYNHKELRARLVSRGHRFRSNSDTEVILRAYEEYGLACVDELDGMFAFAIYDRRNRQLFAARDRLGKKPFFYAMFGGVFHFASELPALKHSPLWNDEIDPTALEGYLSLGYVVGPLTIYKNVRKLQPGSTLHVRDGQVTTRQYWDIQEFDTDHRDDSEILAELDERLRSAVHRRLDSDVPLGAFLSGGVDSGLVVSYMAERLTQLTTISVGFGELAHNELAMASLTAQHIGSHHYAEVIPLDLSEVFEKVTARLGEPMADSSAIPTWYLAQAARTHVSVVLSGDGGDEAFAGYDFRYLPHALEELVRPQSHRC